MSPKINSVFEIKLTFVTFFILAILCLNLLSIVNLFQDIGLPFGGYLTFFNPITNEYTIDKGFPPWWNKDSHLDQHMILLEINGEPYTEEIARYIYNENYLSSRETVDLLLGYYGNHYREEIVVRSFSIWDYLDIKLPLIVISFSLWILAITIYLAKPSDVTNQVAAVLFALFSLSFGGDRSALYWHDGVITKFIDIAMLTLPALEGAAISHFALSYPTPLKCRYKQILIKCVYGIGTVFALIYASSHMLLWYSGQSHLVARLNSRGFYLSYSLFAMSVLFVFARLVLSSLYPQSSQRRIREKRIARITLLGLIVPFVFIFLGALERFSQAEMDYYWLVVDIRYFFLVLPWLISYLVLRYQTFRSSPRSLVLLSIIIGSVLVGNLVYSLALMLIDENYPTLIHVPIILGMLASSGFWAFQTKWSGLFGRLFNHQQLNYTIANQYGSELLNYAQDLHRLPQAITQSLKNNLDIELIGFWLYENPVLELKSMIGISSIPDEIQSISNLEWDDNTSVYYSDNIGRHSWLSAFSILDGVEIIMPLSIKGKLIGVLILGNRINQEIFDERDLVVLNLIAQQTSLHIESALQYKEKLLARQIERRLIGFDLHDSVLQYVGTYLPFTVYASLEHMRQGDFGEARRLMDELLEKNENENTKLRWIFKGIMEDALSESLRSICSTGGSSKSIKIEFFDQVDSDYPIQNTLLTYDISFILNELLNNIAKHGNGDSVSVTLQTDVKGLCIKVCDEESEISPNVELSTQGHGLTSIKHRLSRYEGDYSLTNMAENRGYLSVIRVGSKYL